MFQQIKKFYIGEILSTGITSKTARRNQCGDTSAGEQKFEFGGTQNTLDVKF